MKNNNTFDIIIAGGGLSGALSALSLAKLTNNSGNKLSIAIIEANPILQQPKSTYDSRVLALSHGSVSYLKSLNAWHSLDEVAAPIKHIHISDRGHYGKARIDAQDHNVSALGHVVELSLLGQALLAELEKLENISWFCPDKIQKIDWQTEQVNISLESKRSIVGKLLLACDGAQSSCRQFANIASTDKPYQQSALIANVSMARAHKNIAYERFTQYGPIAMLPLLDGSGDSHKCSLVWTMPPEQAQQVLAYSDDKFQHELELAFGSWLGAVEKAGERVVYPLHLVQAKEQVFHRMVLVGNASHTIHPIAGQGFNLGLRDVEQLTKLIETQLKNNEDIANFYRLSQYAQQRRQDHQEVITLTDSLVTLFSNDLFPLVVGRNIGVKVLNYLTPIKKAFVNKTMGY